MPGLFSIGDLAERVQRSTSSALSARIVGDARKTVAAVAPLESAQADDLSFLANPRYRRVAAATRAGALVLADADRAALFETDPGDRVLVVCEAPYTWFAFAAQALAPSDDPSPGCASSAVLHAGAVIDPAASIGALAVIEDGVRVGARARIGAGCYLGAGVQIGEGTVLHAGVRIYHGCRIGARCILHSGSVVGADGFGFAPFQKRWIKIPQIGGVCIGDDVEIGACSTIDRGAMGDTVIEDGVKIDNQVQIAHNCRIGAHTAIAGSAGVAGSAIIGRRCQIGGASVINGHVSIADDTVISGATAITGNVRKAGFYTGIFPFMSNRDWERSAVLLRHLDELRERVRALEAQLRNRPTETER